MTARHSTKRILIAGAVTGVLAAGLTACSDDPETAEPTETLVESQASVSPQSETEDVEAAPEALSNNANAPKAMLAAAATGLKQVPGGTVVSIDRGPATWEIHVVTSDGTEHEMEMAAGGATIVRGPIVDQDDADDLAEQSALAQTKTIGYEAAAKHALTEVPQGQLTELDLETDRGQTHWEAKVLDDQQVECSVRIDATTGDILGNQYDD